MTAMNIDAKQLKDLIAREKIVLVDFWAPWCPHCRKINPAYEQIATEYAGRLKAVKVDMDEDETLWEELNVELIPTLRLYVDGKPVDFPGCPGVEGCHRGVSGWHAAQGAATDRRAHLRHDHHRRRTGRIYGGAVRGQSGA